MPSNYVMMLAEIWETVSYYGMRLIHGLGFVLYLFKKFGVLLYRGVYSWFLWLWEFKNRRRLTEQKQRLNSLQNRISELEKDKMKLEEQKAELIKWYQPKTDDFDNLKRTARNIRSINNKKAALAYFDALIDLTGDYLDDLLRGPQESKPSEHNLKQIYGPYGLLLSARDFRSTETPSPSTKQEVLGKIVKKYTFLQGHESRIEARCVDPSLSLVRSMLTLLPPLLITQPKWQHDDIQDTNRSSWNENKRGPLIYYRPVLVYGNQLNVAAKGLVGNS